jgi:hypothetical protein
MFASEIQRHWRARPIFSAYATFGREVQASCIHKESHQGEINDHQIDIFRDAPWGRPIILGRELGSISSEVIASKTTASEMT